MEQRGVFNQVKEFRSKCWITAVDSFILISWVCSFVMAGETNRLNHWIRIDRLEGTHKNHWVQPPHHFQASQKSKHVIEGVIQMCLEHWQACGISDLSRNPVPVFDHHHSKEMDLVINDREKFMSCFNKFQSMLRKQPRDRYTTHAKNNDLGAFI